MDQHSPAISSSSSEGLSGSWSQHNDLDFKLIPLKDFVRLSNLVKHQTVSRDVATQILKVMDDVGVLQIINLFRCCRLWDVQTYDHCLGHVFEYRTAMPHL